MRLVISDSVWQVQKCNQQLFGAMAMLLLTFLSTAIMSVELCFSYCSGNKQLYTLFASMYHNAAFNTFMMVQVVLLFCLAFRVILRLLYGSLSSTETNYLDEKQWDIFAELVSSYVTFQNALGLVGFMHVFFMYYLALVTVLLEKRIEEVCTAERDEQTNEPDLAHPRPLANNGWTHSRIALTIVVLYLVNGYALQYQAKHLQYALYRYSLLTAVTIHRYVVTSVALGQAIASYLLYLTEAQYFSHEWDNKFVFESLVDVLAFGLVAVSNVTVVLLAFWKDFRGISLIQLAIRNVKHFVSAVDRKSVV